MLKRILKWSVVTMYEPTPENSTYFIQHLKFLLHFYSKKYSKHNVTDGFSLQPFLQAHVLNMSEMFFCMEVKPGPCLQKTCHELKDVNMQ